MKERAYTLKELAQRAELRARRCELLSETLLLVHGGPEELEQMDKLDIEIDQITAELENIE
ncbi:MAG: hypothetical protein ABFC94_05485 [Syntrophomonas sp.]